MHREIRSIEDVLMSEEFLAWHKNPNSEMGQVWAQWMNQQPQIQQWTQQAVENLKRYHEKEQAIWPPVNTLAALNKLQSRIQNEQTATIPTKSLAVKSNIRQLFFRAAMGIAASLLLYAGVVYWQQQPGEAMAANFGQVEKEQLPDGSEVMLNANSKVVLARSFSGGGAREVWIEGEAYFKVKKTKAKRKFIVHANQFDIVVTGTQFNVVNRDGKTRVTLKEGSIIVEREGQRPIALKPGESFEINRNQAIKTNVTNNNDIAWTQKKIVLDNTRLLDIAALLKQHYGIQVVLEGPDVYNQTLTGIMPNDNLETFLAAMEATGKYHLTLVDNTLKIELLQAIH